MARVRADVAARSDRPRRSFSVALGRGAARGVRGREVEAGQRRRVGPEGGRRSAARSGQLRPHPGPPTAQRLGRRGPDRASWSPPQRRRTPSFATWSRPMQLRSAYERYLERPRSGRRRDETRSGRRGEPGLERPTARLRRRWRGTPRSERSSPSHLASRSAARARRPPDVERLSRCAGPGSRSRASSPGC